MRRKKCIFIFIITVLITLIIGKNFKSLVTYKNSFNSNVYGTMIQITSHSNGVIYYTNELLNGEYKQYNVIKLRSNYDEVLQDIQQLNNSVVGFNKGSGIEVSKICNVVSLIDLNDLEQRTPLVLSQDEIKALTEINKIFTEISNIIDENTKDIQRGALGVPNVLKDDVWIKIIKEINE